MPDIQQTNTPVPSNAGKDGGLDLNIWTEQVSDRIRRDLYTLKYNDSTFFGAIQVTGDFNPTTCITDSAGFLDEDDMLSDATSSVASQQSIKAYVNSVGFVDRGDPTAFDFEVSDFETDVTDGTWRDLDLSSIVPAGAKAVLLQMQVKDDMDNVFISFRKNGNSNAINTSKTRTQVADIYVDAEAIVACDTDRKIEYIATNTVWTEIVMVVKGWWL